MGKAAVPNYERKVSATCCTNPIATPGTKSSETLIRYVEEHLTVAVLWLIDGRLQGGLAAQEVVLDVAGQAAR